MTVYAYIRVSTDKQDCANQKLGIDAKANALGLTIDKYIEDDGISGTKEPEKRALGKLLNILQSGDVVIVSELSRFGRKLFMLFRILEKLLNTGVFVYSVKDGYTLDNSIQSKVLAFAFGMAAEIERDMIAKRTKEALARKKSMGYSLGRKPGSRNKSRKLDNKENIIQKMLNDKKTHEYIAKKLHVSTRTLARKLAQTA